MLNKALDIEKWIKHGQKPTKEAEAVMDVESAAVGKAVSSTSFKPQHTGIHTAWFKPQFSY